MLRRRILIDDSQDEGLYVDLGLPSGILWAKGNLVKDSNDNYSIGEETDLGTYVSWGNIVGHNEDEYYNFSLNYDNTAGASVTSNIAINDAQHDIAVATLGAPWHLPTYTDFNELKNNTDTEFVTINGVNGRKFMKKTDHTKYVFFPASGHSPQNTVGNVGQLGHYYSSTVGSESAAYFLFFSTQTTSLQLGQRQYGRTIRPVTYNE